MPITEAIETLADWMHTQFLTTTNPVSSKPWANLSEVRKNEYRRLARVMLESPPDVLCEAMRRLEEG